MSKSVIEGFRRYFREAASRGFPSFLGPVERSTPLNSSPYVAHLRDVRTGGILSSRAAFTAQLCAAVDELRRRGAPPIAALLGGSVLGDKPDPGDLDCIIFYEVAGDCDLSWLGAFQSDWRGRRLDLRLVPADSDPLLLIKAVSFFTTLFSARRPGDEPVRGLVLLDCRE